MAKVDITFEFDSVEELGSLMHKLGRAEANDYITDIWVDLEHNKGDEDASK